MSAVLSAVPIEETVHRFRWTPEAFLQVAELGVFGYGNEHEVELIDGEIIEKMPESELHAYTSTVLADALRELFGPEYSTNMCRSLRFPYSQPIPDVVVLRGSARDYKGRFPQSDEIALVVEVSNTTIRLDQNQKQAMYARNGISEYWVVNVQTHEVTSCRNPDPETATYNDCATYGEADSVSPLHAPGQSIRIAELF